MNVSHALRIAMKAFTLIHNYKDMKVFINVRSGSYSGGMILVAANTKEEAIKAFRKTKTMIGCGIKWKTGLMICITEKTDGWNLLC